MRKFVIACVLLVGTVASAQQPARSTAPPLRAEADLTAGTTRKAQAAAAAPRAPAERVARIDRWLQQYVDENRIGGAVALVLQDGKPVYERAVGWSDKEAGRRMTPAPAREITPL